MEHALVSARAALRAASTPLGAPEAFSLLVANGRIAQALELGRLFSLDVTDAFGALAANVVRGIPLLRSDDEWADCFTGEKPLVQLERLVRQHDNRHSNFGCGRSAAAVLLRRSRSASSCIHWLLQHNAPALLQLYLSRAMLPEAIAVVEALVSRKEDASVASD